MTYDGFVVAAVAAELRRTILRGQVQKVRQHNKTDVTLEIRAPGHTYLLFLSADARFARLHLTASPNPVPKEAPNFCMLLRKYIDGAFLSQVEQIGMDRILKLHFDSSEHGKLALVVEIMGKHSNIILIDAADKILGAIKHVGASVSRYRQVLPGRDYIPPPGVDKIDARGLTPALFDKLWSASLPDTGETAIVKKWIVEKFSGFGPFLADEAIALAGGAQVKSSDVRDAILRIGEIARTESFGPVFITGEHGEGVAVYPIRSAQFPPDRQFPRPSINEALDALFRGIVTRTRLEDQRAQVLTAIKRAAASKKQALKSVERTISEAEKSERYKQIGELILANLHAIEKGARSIIVADFFDPDMPEVVIELDEKLTPQQNAERSFKRFRKARDAAASAVQRRERITRDIELLEAALRDTESSESVDSLQSLRRMLTNQGLLRSETVREREEDEFAGHRIRRFTTPDGWEILYGETSQANDHLTQRVARPNDVWLHARQITGAHVIIRTAGKKRDVPRPVLIQAALIAARNSDAKHSSLVPIDYTFRKHVRKPRGAAPGFVTYRGEKTIDVNPA